MKSRCSATCNNSVWFPIPNRSVDSQNIVFFPENGEKNNMHSTWIHVIEMTWLRCDGWNPEVAGVPKRQRLLPAAFGRKWWARGAAQGPGGPCVISLGQPKTNGKCPKRWSSSILLRVFLRHEPFKGEVEATYSPFVWHQPHNFKNPLGLW